MPVSLKNLLASLIALSTLCASLQLNAFEVAPFVPNVVDQAKVLSSDEIATLNEAIQEIRTEANVWAAVYFVKTLGDESIESAAEKTFRQWELGKKGQDNGILFIFAIDDRKARIEVGYGLEGDVPDLRAKMLLDTVILPEFKNSKYSAGVLSGLYSIGYLVSKKETLLAKSGASSVELNANPFEANSPFDFQKGFGYWKIWALFLIFMPMLARLFKLLSNVLPKEISDFKAPTAGTKIRYLLGLNKGSLLITIFLLLNPGVFILLSPHFIKDFNVDSALSMWLHSNALLLLKEWGTFLFVVPALLKCIGYFIGKNRPNKNPKFFLKGMPKFMFLLDLDESLIGKVFLAVFFTVLCLALASQMGTSFLLNGQLPALIIMLLLTLRYWKNRALPLLSEKAYHRIKARERLNRIHTRVYGTRQVFGKTYTYSRPSSRSSSSSSSSRSSSSGGGRSGGGGASSSW